jgi:hypothetical protein
MELKIRTLQGSCVLSIDLEETKTVGELQALLHQQHKDDPLHVPQPEKQRLVRTPMQQPLPTVHLVCCHVHIYMSYSADMQQLLAHSNCQPRYVLHVLRCVLQVFKQAVLPADAALQHVGLTSGDQLVLLVPKKLQQRPTPQSTPVRGCIGETWPA